MRRDYGYAIAEGARTWGDQWDASQLENVDSSIRHAFETGDRVEVTTTYDNGETFVRRGRVSKTTGWRPSFLLMHRVSDIGSWDTLGPKDRVTKWISA